MKSIRPNFSNGTEFECWFYGQCDGCSRNREEPNWCNLQSCIMIGELTPTQAKNAGFDEQGNPPEKLKCYRHYKKRKDSGAPLFKELDK